MKLDWSHILKHRGLIRHLVNRYITNLQDQEDMLHDVMVRLVEKRYEYDPSKCRKLSAWFWIKTKQVVLDIIRQQQHCRHARTAERWGLVNRPWGDTWLGDVKAKEENGDTTLARSYLANMRPDLQSFTVLRLRGVTKEAAQTATGIRNRDYVEFRKLFTNTRYVRAKKVG